MARKFTRSRGRLGAQRRESLWVGLTPTNTGLAAGGATLILTASSTLLALRPFTIIRTHITWHVASDQSTAKENYAAAIGGCVVSDQAEAIGITAVPTPVTDLSSDLFFLWDSAIGIFDFTTGTGYREVGHLQKIDSKAMRRVNDDQTVIFTIEDEPTIGTDGVSVKVIGRQLIKLH